jgi:hypothetical protein
MPLVNNSFVSGNVVWECAKCGDVFAYIDVGKEHEKNCNGKSQQEKPSGNWADQIKTGKRK